MDCSADFVGYSGYSDLRDSRGFEDFEGYLGLRDSMGLTGSMDLMGYLVLGRKQWDANIHCDVDSGGGGADDKSNRHRSQNMDGTINLE